MLDSLEEIKSITLCRAILPLAPTFEGRGKVVNCYSYSILKPGPEML